MEVTTSNFNDVLPEIERAIAECTFLSIDSELTGLKAASDNRINSYDTPKQYYEKVRRDCKEFLLIQFGLSFFKYDKEQDVFKNKSYNFYIFRRPNNRYVQEQRFLCQTSSIDFLIQNGFDFNKLFKEGLPYLNISEQNRCKEALDEQRKKIVESKGSKRNGNLDVIPIPEESQEFINDIINKLELFVKNGDKELALPKCNAFLRRLIYQTAAEKFSDTVHLETRLVDKDRVLYATRFKTEEEKAELENKKLNEMEANLDDFVGFTKVMQKIVDSSKVVVGHNIMLDLLHSIDTFLTPLPDDYEEFKECAHSLFPNLLDTKYMSSLPPFREIISSNVLKSLLDTVCEEPFQMPKIEIEAGYKGYTIKDAKEHEAGYDAYITGVSFLAMWKYLGNTGELSNAEIFEDFILLKPYINKIFLMRLADNQYVNLGGEDLKPSRDHVFCMTFPKDWKNNNIFELFSPFGNVHIAWVDETSAYVGLYKKDLAAAAFSALSKSDMYSIVPFTRHQAALAGVTTPLPSPTPAAKRRTTADQSQPVAKKRRTGSFDRQKSKRSIETIAEEQGDEDECPKSEKKKVFQESDWD